MISVHMRTQQAIVVNRQFAVNTGVSIYGKVTGASGLGAILTAVRLTIPETGFFQDKQTNAFGDYNFYLVTPSSPQRLTLRIVATFSLSGQETVSVPIVVGNLGVPVEPEQPESSDVFAGLSESAKEFAKFLAIGALVVGFIWFLPYLLPRIKSAFAK